MKTRNGFVSNSSSSSFIVNDPYCRNIKGLSIQERRTPIESKQTLIEKSKRTLIEQKEYDAKK